MSEETKAEKTERIEVQRTIPADAARIFAVLRDPQGHVTIDSSGMLQDSTGEPAGKVDDEFVVHMDRESLNDYPMGKYDVTVHITTLRARPRDRLDHPGADQAADRPRLRLHARAGRGRRTLVTSYYDWSDIAPEWREANIFPVISETALRATLGILERTLARSTPVVSETRPAAWPR